MFFLVKKEIQKNIWLKRNYSRRQIKTITYNNNMENNKRYQMQLLYKRLEIQTKRIPDKKYTYLHFETVLFTRF